MLAMRLAALPVFAHPSLVWYRLASSGRKGTVGHGVRRAVAIGCDDTLFPASITILRFVTRVPVTPARPALHLPSPPRFFHKRPITPCRWHFYGVRLGGMGIRRLVKHDETLGR